MGGMMNGFGFGGFGLIGMVFNLVITVGVIVGVVLLIMWLVRQTGSSRSGFSGQRGADASLTPTEILKRRYAQGEITREQYQQMLADLG